MQIVSKSDFLEQYDIESLNVEREKQRKKWMWIILIGCFLFQMLPYCVAVNLTNVFVGSDWIHWLKNNATIVGLTFTIGALVSALVGPTIAKLFNKQISLRLIYGIGVIAAMVGFMGLGINALIPAAHRSLLVVTIILWTFFAISQIGVMIFSGLGVNNLISTWWPQEKRGVALGFAFAGGSLGNIWMQQLLGVLGKEFGNVAGQNYNEHGNQWVTYLILGLIGLVMGLIIVMFTCKKPLPKIDIMGELKKGEDTFSQCVGCGKEFKENELNIKSTDAATFLDVRKYPIYWILAIAYLVLEMGTVPASLNGLIISHSLIVSHPYLNYNSVMALGGTLFGISCLIGNFCGGILNDKLGPNKSIALAGTFQCLSIFCLMYAIKEPSIVYIYFILSGVSVYVYTSTPAFISGRLYGAKTSNLHMAILGIFIAVGFAFVNSISGVITGPTTISNMHTMFGYRTEGNIFALLIFALVCMGFGAIVVSWCATIIMNKGIKGLREYSPTKFSQIIFIKHSLFIKSIVFKFIHLKKDVRESSQYKAKIEKKREKLNPTKQRQQEEKYINKSNQQIENNNKKLQITIKKLQIKLDKLNQLHLQSNINESVKKHIDAKVEKLTNKQKELIKQKTKIDWNKYEKEYRIVSRIITLKNKLTKSQDQLNKKIELVNTKINIAKYKINFENQKLIEGNQLLTTYFDDVYGMVDRIITKTIENKLESELIAIKNKNIALQRKYDSKNNLKKVKKRL